MTEPTTPVSVPTDDLRKQVNELGALAQALFEAQFSRCEGGRMPADPTWDELEPSERDEFWEQARNARHVFGARAVPVPDAAEANIRALHQPETVEGDCDRRDCCGGPHEYIVCSECGRDRSEGDCPTLAAFGNPPPAPASVSGGQLLEQIARALPGDDDPADASWREECAEAVFAVVAPRLADIERLRALHHTPYVDEEHRGGNCVDALMSQAAENAQLRVKVDLVSEDSDRIAREGMEIEQTLRAELATAKNAAEQYKIQRDQQGRQKDIFAKHCKQRLAEIVDLRVKVAALEAQHGTVTARQRTELQTNIRFAISDPGSTHSRIAGETVPAWGSRAVMDVLNRAGLLRPVSSTEQEGQTR